jgi:NADPH:quinone reductase
MTANEVPSTARQLRSTVNADGTLVLSIVSVDVPEPKVDEVVVRVEAAPINPSDLGLLLGGADLASFTSNGDAANPVVRAAIGGGMLASMKARFGESMAVGNEGGGVVVKAGSGAAAQALLGKTVGFVGGATYSQYRCVHVTQTLELPAGTSTRDAASCFVNPLTALGMTETMKMEGHSALVHTAAASNLGQMLNKICIADGIKLVNIVRKPEQEDLLRSIGATIVCDSSKDTFTDDLTNGLIETGATIAFDAIGGGRLVSQILSCMEAAANATAKEYSRYGSTVHKQVYIYGGLDRSPTELQRSYGMMWGIGGWLLTPFMQKLGVEGVQRLRARVANEITTTFASSYTQEVSLVGALSLDAIAVYGKQATGEKYLINPSL